LCLFAGRCKTNTGRTQRHEETPGIFDSGELRPEYKKPANMHHFAGIQLNSRVFRQAIIRQSRLWKQDYYPNATHAHRKRGLKLVRRVNVKHWATLCSFVSSWLTALPASGSLTRRRREKFGETLFVPNAVEDRMNFLQFFTQNLAILLWFHFDRFSEIRYSLLRLVSLGI
jgi:hypothetical protein